MSAHRSLLTTAALAVICLASTALGQATLGGEAATSWSPPRPGHVWTYGGSPWHPVDVALANHGTQVFMGIWQGSPQGPHCMLLSSHDSGVASPIWAGLPEPAGTEKAHMADAADLTDVHVVFTYEDTAVLNQRIHRLHKSSSQGLDWTYTYPHLGAGRVVAGVSEDGDVIVGALDDPTSDKVDVLVFGPDAAVPVQVLELPDGVLWGFDLAAQGTHAAFASGSVFRVLELSTGTVHELYDASPTSLSERGVAISGDGSVVACHGFPGIFVYEWTGSGYEQTWFRSLAGSAVIDVSRDGSTMAFGCDFGYSSPTILTECVDLETKTVTLSEAITNTGAYPNGVSDISITPDGSLFATATWGDEFGLVPEVRVYSRSGHDPVQTFDLPGSALAVDISPDGRRVVAGSEPQHLFVPSAGGRIDLFDLGGSDLIMSTTPTIGATVSFRVFGAPGSVAVLLDAPGLASPPIAIPWAGLLHLDPTTLAATPMGPIGASGSRGLDWVLPADPALVGVSHYFQGLTFLGTRRLTTDWLVVTYLP